MTIQVRQSDGMMRQFCRWCEDEYAHEFNPHGEWMPPSIENHVLIEQAERDHAWNHHTPAILKGNPVATGPQRVFWDDLGEDMKDPEFRAAFTATSQEIRRDHPELWHGDWAVTEPGDLSTPAEPEGEDDECE